MATQQKSTSKSAVLILALVMAAMGCNVAPDEAAKESGAADIRALGQAITYDGHDYLFVNTLVTWQMAQAYCRSVG